MKRFITSYFLILLYIITAFGQLMPIIKDAVSHTFAEAIHIATVHAKYGINHLSKEIGESTQKGKKTDFSKYAESYEVHTKSDEFSLTPTGFYIDAKFCILIIRRSDLISISKQSPPPRYSC